MANLNEQQLELLFSFGLLTKEEKDSLTKKYKASNSLIELRSSFMEILEKSLHRLSEEIENSEQKLKETMADRDKTGVEIADEIDEVSNKIAQAYKNDIESFRKSSSKALEKYEFEIAAIDREMDQKFAKDVKKIEEMALNTIRGKITQS